MIGYRFFYNLISLIITTLPLATFTMDHPAPNVELFVKNSLWSVLGNPSIQVNATKKGITTATTVRPKQENNIGYLDQLQKLEVEGYGRSKKEKVALTDIPLNHAIEEWNRLRVGKKDDLIVEVSWKNWTDINSDEIVFSYSTRPRPIKQKMDDPPKYPRTKNPLSVFGDIVYYQLESTLTPEMIERSTSWKEVLVPAKWWGFERATTAEDAYRYILGLTENYSRDDIKTKYQKLATLWHPDKVPKDDESQKFGEQVFRLIKKAKNGLEEALEDKKKEASGGWVNL